MNSPDNDSPPASELIQIGMTHHQAGRLQEAEAIYQSILQKEPEHPDALHLFGILAHQVGQHDIAVNLIESAIRANPEVPEFYNNCGEACRALHDNELAISRYEQAIAINPDFAEAHNNLGIALYELERVEEARERYEQALAINPDFAQAHNNLGNALRELGQADEAIAHYEQAIDMQAGYAEAHNNYGNALRDLDRSEDAISAYEQAISINPDYAEAHNNLGIALNDLNRYEEATTYHERAIAIRPDFAEAHNNRGVALNELGRKEEAISCYEQTLAIKPDYAEAYNNMGIALNDLGRREEAIAAYEKAIAIQPGFAGAHNNMGSALNDLGRGEEAISAYEKAINILPVYIEAHDNLAHILLAQGRLEEAKQCFNTIIGINESAWGAHVKLSTLLPVIPSSREAIVEARQKIERDIELLGKKNISLEDPYLEVGLTNFYLAYHDLNDVSIQKKIAEFYIQACPLLTWTAAHCASYPMSSRREHLRIGIVSAFIRNHTIGKLMAGIIEKLSRQQFEVIIFHCHHESSPMVDSINSTADKVINLPKDLSEAREIIADHELDVLFYPDIGMDPFTFFLAFSRLAPVQCVSWGHPMTTGIPNMDYFLSSELLEPEGAESHYTEQLIKLNHLPTYYIPPKTPAKPVSRESLGLPADARLYVCPQSLFKLHPDFDETLAELLRRDPDGLLVLLDGALGYWNTLLQTRFRKRFPDVAEQIFFVRRMDHDEFLAFLGMADALLDPHHFSGGNSSYEAFTYGLPIVTWPSGLMRGRVTFACYRRMEMMDLVADSQESYVDLAIRLANDKDWKKTLRDKIKKQSKVLYEDLEMVHDMERFFTAAVEAARHGEKMRS